MEKDRLAAERVDVEAFEQGGNFAGRDDYMRALQVRRARCPREADDLGVLFEGYDGMVRETTAQGRDVVAQAESAGNQDPLRLRSVARSGAGRRLV